MVRGRRNFIKYGHSMIPDLAVPRPPSLLCRRCPCGSVNVPGRESHAVDWRVGVALARLSSLPPCLLAPKMNFIKVIKRKWSFLCWSRCFPGSKLKEPKTMAYGRCSLVKFRYFRWPLFFEITIKKKYSTNSKVQILHPFSSTLVKYEFSSFQPTIHPLR